MYILHIYIQIYMYIYTHIIYIHYIYMYMRQHLGTDEVLDGLAHGSRHLPQEHVRYFKEQRHNLCGNALLRLCYGSVKALLRLC
jgi:hypothetical protein